MAAAAQTYFNQSLAELEPHEAAMLAAMPQAPGRYHPVRAKERVTERRNPMRMPRTARRVAQTIRRSRL